MQNVIDKTGLSKSFVETKIRHGEFLLPVKLGARASGFIEEEADQRHECHNLGALGGS